MSSFGTPFMGLFGDEEEAPDLTGFYARQKRKDEEAAREAARKEADRIRKRRGYAASIATGPQGVTTPATTTSTTLLGE